MAALAADLAAESAVTRDLVAGLDEAGWRTPTPAAGWDIGDQISHLAYFDEVALHAALDPDDFRAELAAAPQDVDADVIAARYRDRAGTELLAWFDASRAQLITTFAAMDPKKWLPWIGPDMSAASSLTARLMETWAHTQDIADALGVTREPTARLRHVAHIGVLTRGFSFVNRHQPVPQAQVRVELAAPDGTVWTWGQPDAPERVTGPALDFCLLVTQRRHRDDLALAAEGPGAREWLTIAQAFAGGPGPGRARKSPAGEAHD
jgi:uncharacterized protein (TIGR03084 family)